MKDKGHDFDRARHPPPKIHLDTLDGVKISFLQTGTTWPSRPDLKRRQILNFALSCQIQLLRRKVLQNNSLIPAPFLKSKVTLISKMNLLAALPLPHQTSIQLVGRKTSERSYYQKFGGPFSRPEAPFSDQFPSKTLKAARWRNIGPLWSSPMHILST